MTLQQLRYFCEVARQDMNISKAAAALHITQPDRKSTRLNSSHT